MEVPELPEDIASDPHMAWLHLKMLQLYRNSRRTSINLPTVAAMLMHPDAPPPTKEELNHVNSLLEQEIALLIDLKAYIQRLLDHYERRGTSAPD
ncbi:MAG: hypothetical protein LDL41_25930 [Coleofasciculus sp. S288]|nr:hypothetical protein [Coleofasciculus sp. S288]